MIDKKSNNPNGVDERARTAGGTLIRKKSKALNSLVKNRMVVDGLKQLLNEALNSTLSGAWNKFTQTDRTPQEIVKDCENLLEEMSKKKIDHNEMQRIPSHLVAELAAFPEVYQIILSMIGAETEEKLSQKYESPIQIDKGIIELNQHSVTFDNEGNPNNYYDENNNNNSYNVNNEDSVIDEGCDVNMFDPVMNHSDNLKRDDSAIEGFLLVK